MQLCCSVLPIPTANYYTFMEVRKLGKGCADIITQDKVQTVKRMQHNNLDYPVFINVGSQNRTFK